MNKARELMINFTNIWNQCSVRYLEDTSKEVFPPKSIEVISTKQDLSNKSAVLIHFNALSFIQAITEEDSEMILCLLAEKLTEEKSSRILENYFYWKEKQEIEREDNTEHPLFQPETEYEAL